MNNLRKYLGQSVTVKIDRPLGSKHPQWDFLYPVNYGYIPKTKAPDGEGIDAYVLGVSVPRREFTGIGIAIIHRTDDNDDKLVVVPVGKSYTDTQIRALTEFQEKYFQSEIIRK